MPKVGQPQFSADVTSFTYASLDTRLLHANINTQSYQATPRIDPVRTTKTVSISLPPAQYRKAERIARRENRTMSELVREALRRYEEDSASAGAARAALAIALEAVQKDASRKGRNRLSKREIATEIVAARKSRKAPATASA